MHGRCSHPPHPPVEVACAALAFCPWLWLRHGVPLGERHGAGSCAGIHIPANGWTCRFDMTYIDEENTKQRPIMIHRAIFGSLERFFGILIENYAGAFPIWLAPTQVRSQAVQPHWLWPWLAAAQWVDAFVREARPDPCPAIHSLKACHCLFMAKGEVLDGSGFVLVFCGEVGTEPPYTCCAPQCHRCACWP